MKIMGIDTSLVPGEDYSILSIAIVEDNEVCSINTIEIDKMDDSLGELIAKVFNDSQCNYLAMDISGVNKCLYEKISQHIKESKLKCISYSVTDLNNLVKGLIKDKCLKRLGMELQYEHHLNTGRYKLSYSSEFAMTTAYAIGVANSECNK